jgi:hypothetical protein
MRSDPFSRRRAQQAASRPFSHRVVVKKTAFRGARQKPDALGSIQELYGLLARDEAHNAMILDDVTCRAGRLFCARKNVRSCKAISIPNRLPAADFEAYLRASVDHVCADRVGAVVG